MSERVSRLLPNQAVEGMMLGTFHSICARILRREADQLPIQSNFVIFDTDDQERIVKNVIREMKINEKLYRPASVLGAISRAKNELIGADDYPTQTYRDEIVKSLYAEAENIAKRAVKAATDKKYDFDQKIDRLVTSPIAGLPIMLILLSIIIWLTVTGANVVSAWIATVLFAIGDIGRELFTQIGMPWWITGFIWDGVYLGLAWVVSVMLPPMMIFFPAFTFLEDLGYLPRVAFNLDWMFKKTGSHGKQSLTMAMGFGCNAAGVISTRVIDSPRERLIAILTNNFVPCNGRFPL
jgi:ferrous iron transport protein B